MGEVLLMNKLPKLMILATGGTIAGGAADSTEMTGYQAGVFGIETLLAAVPQIKNYAEVIGEQVCDIDSCNMTEQIWFQLASKVNTLLRDETIEGVIITHGTDTLEETAYFLNLVVKSEKPVVFVGAMRPATAMSADGPLNLLNAVRLAVSKEASSKGVLVVMNDEIHGARDVTKTHTTNVSTFKALELGALGYMHNGKPSFYRMTTRRHTKMSVFSLDGLTSLPQVEIIYAHANQSRLLIDATLRAGVKGIVYAGMGNGSIHTNAEAGLIDAAKQGIIVVRSSRCGNGSVIASNPEWEENHFIKADTLNPQKARLLLALALTKTKNVAQIQDIFDTY
ncbi:MAG: L-asparaginase [Firmicutes bacterium]|nr:L-asparaginase [Bacillota bacterium]